MIFDDKNFHLEEFPYEILKGRPLLVTKEDIADILGSNIKDVRGMIELVSAELWLPENERGRPKYYLHQIPWMMKRAAFLRQQKFTTKSKSK